MNKNIGSEGVATRFKPGQSGNPAGRPPRKRIKDLLAAALDRPLGPEARKSLSPAIRAELPENAQYADALVVSIILRAIDKADVKAIREIREAVEGKTPRKHR